MEKLKDKIVVITGSTRGFGYAAAQALLAAEARVVVSGRSKKGVSRCLCKRESLDCKATFESDHQLVEDGWPVLNRHGPFFDDIAMGQEQQLAGSLRGGENALGFRHLAQLGVIAFD